MRSVRPDLARLPVAAMLVAPWFLAACVVQVDSESVVATEQERFEVDGTPEVALATFDGRIEVRGWNRPEVVVDVEKRGATTELLDQIRIDSHQDGHRIRVQVRRPAEGTWALMGAPHSARIIAKVPTMSDVMARSDDGAIKVEGVEGQIDLRTADGSLTALRVRGDVRAHTGDGRIKVEDVDGRCDLTTGDGSISVRGQLTDVKVRTGDGSVTLRALPGSRMGTGWNVATGDGSVLVMLPSAFAADVDAFTGDGRVRVTGLTADLHGPPALDDDEREQRSLRAQLGVGGHLLKIRTSDGSITLRSSQ